MRGRGQASEARGPDGHPGVGERRAGAPEIPGLPSTRILREYPPPRTLCAVNPALRTLSPAPAFI